MNSINRINISKDIDINIKDIQIVYKKLSINQINTKNDSNPL